MQFRHWMDLDDPSEVELEEIEGRYVVPDFSEFYSVQYPRSLPNPVPFEWSERDDTWRLKAACRGQGRTPETIKVWFPKKGNDSKQAQEWCRSCPVVDECNNFANKNNITWGVYGGRIRHRDGTLNDEN